MASNNFVLRRTLTGVGLFTLQVIPEGKRLIEYAGPVINAEEVQRKGGKYLFEMNRNLAIDGSSRSNLALYQSFVSAECASLYHRPKNMDMVEEQN